MNIVEKIDKLRLEKNWTYYKLAEESCLPISTITNMFVRKSSPSISTLTSICNGLGITLGQFFASNKEELENEQEKILLDTFKKLNDSNKKLAINILNLLDNSNINMESVNQIPS